MPIVAVAAGVYGATSLVAGGLTVLETVSAIGAIVSAVGVVTGNKDLAMIGGIAGVAGGIGAFAQSQGWLASGNAGSAMGDTASNIEAMTQTQAPGLESTMNPTDMRLEAGTQTTPSGLMDAGAADTAATGATQAAITEANPLAAQSPASQAMGAGPNADVNPTDLRLAAGTQTSPMGGPSFGGGAGVLDTIKGFLADKENRSLLGNFIGGMFDREKAAKTDYYSALTEQLRRQAANASAVPRLGLHLTPAPGGTFPTTTQTYRPPAVAGGLYSH